MPKVSVIVPVYKVEKYIERCAQSLFEQTMDDIEFIFVDDCTPDCSMELLNSLINKYQSRFVKMNYKVRIEKMPINSGLPAVRRHGIKLATGDYIIHCDSDDWVDRDMYRQMYEKIIENNYDMVACDYFSSNESYNTYCHEEIPSCSGQLTHSILVGRTKAAVWNKMIKHIVYERANISSPVGNNKEDYTIMSQLSLYIHNTTIIHKPLYYYYYNPLSITKLETKERLLENCAQAYNNINVVESYFAKNGVLQLYQNDIAFGRYLSSLIIIPFINQRDVYYYWRQLLIGWGENIFKNPNFTKKEKMKYILIYCRCYPLIQKMNLKRKESL